MCDVPTTNDIYVLLPTGNPDAVAHAKQLIMDKVAEGNVQDRFFLFFILRLNFGGDVMCGWCEIN